MPMKMMKKKVVAMVKAVKRRSNQIIKLQCKTLLPFLQQPPVKIISAGSETLPALVIIVCSELHAQTAGDGLQMSNF